MTVASFGCWTVTAAGVSPLWVDITAFVSVVDGWFHLAQRKAIKMTAITMSVISSQGMRSSYHGFEGFPTTGHGEALGGGGEVGDPVGYQPVFLFIQLLHVLLGLLFSKKIIDPPQCIYVR